MKPLTSLGLLACIFSAAVASERAKESLRAEFDSATPVAIADDDASHLGVWEAISTERRTGMTKPSLIWEVKSDGTILTTIPTIRDSGQLKYSVNPDKEPKEIDLYFKAKPDTALRGIYVIRDNVLTVCYPNGYAHARAPRPATFDVSKDDQYQIKRLKRVSGPTADGVPKPGPSDAQSVVFAALSDPYFTVNKRNAAMKRDPVALDRVIRTADGVLAALATDARRLGILQAKEKLATRNWLAAALRPDEVRDRIASAFAESLILPDTPENRKNFADEMLDAMLLSEKNNARLKAEAERLLQLEKVETRSLLPVLRERFPKATAAGGSVTMAVKLETKLPAEMTLTNAGTKPLTNVVVWFRIEMSPQPGFSEEELKGLAAAYALGAQKAVLNKWSDRQLQDQVTGMGSRNLIFVPTLRPGEAARITYNLGSIRRSKLAVYSLFSDQLKVTNQEIAGVKELQRTIERRFGPGR
ncbi:MAG: hypothetical protein ACRC33_07185 [Gemmataceae bacterium]